MQRKILLRLTALSVGLTLPVSRAALAQYVVGTPITYPTAPALADVAALTFGGTAGGRGVVISTGTAVAVQQLTPSASAVRTLTLPSTITSIGYLSVADVDGDGQQDVVVSAANTGVMAIYYQTSGTVATTAGATVLNLPTAFRPGKVAAADLDADGRKELVTYDASGGTTGSNSIVLIPATGSRTYGSPTLISRPSGGSRRTIYGLFVADYNRDNQPDVLLDYGSPFNAVGYSPGTGTATQLLSESYPIYGGMGLVSADFDNDGSPDLAYTRAVSGTAQLYAALTQASAGRGNFAQTSPIALPAPVISAATADANGDGVADVAVLHSTGVTVVRSGSYSAGLLQPYYTSTTLAPSGVFLNIVATELNGDGKADFLLLNTSRGAGQPDQLLPLLSQNVTATRNGQFDGAMPYPNPSATGAFQVPGGRVVRVLDALGRAVAITDTGDAIQLVTPALGMYMVEWVGRDAHQHRAKWTVQ